MKKTVNIQEINSNLNKTNLVNKVGLFNGQSIWYWKRSSDNESFYTF